MSTVRHWFGVSQARAGRSSGKGGKNMVSARLWNRSRFGWRRLSMASRGVEAMRADVHGHGGWDVRACVVERKFAADFGRRDGEADVFQALNASARRDSVLRAGAADDDERDGLDYVVVAMPGGEIGESIGPEQEV